MTGLSDYGYSTPFQLHKYCIAFSMLQQTLIQHTIIKKCVASSVVVEEPKHAAAAMCIVNSLATNGIPG